MQKKALFVFHRDLRLVDNTSLLAALISSQTVIPCFIFDDRLLKNNQYRGENQIEFMIQCLTELDESLRSLGSQLYYFSGLTHEIVENLIKTEGIDAVYANKDYTPFSILRDEQITQVCKKLKVEFFAHDDALLNPPESVLKDDGKPYTIFTPFYRRAMQNTIPKPDLSIPKNYFQADISLANEKLPLNILKKTNPKLFIKGGRGNALSILNNLQKLKDYDTNRDIPASYGTTGLSAHNKFGTVSIREVYYALASEFGENSGIVRQLFWRDFFTQIAFFFPHVYGHAFNKQFENVKFENDEKKFAAWCEGKTGFPIIDAGIRQLVTTGYMHNRIRMIVSSFLVKDLHIDWRWGEKFFAQHLIDFDSAINNGSWQWAASTGCDAQPYFRIFNPWLQQMRFDQNCIYIKRWVPELQDTPIAAIHKLEKLRLPSVPQIYPDPIVDHKEAKDIARAMFEMAKKRN